MTTLTHHVVEGTTTTMHTKLAYTASAGGAIVAGLTINEVVGVMVGLVSIITMGWTALSNYRRNKLQIELLKSQLISSERDRRMTDRKKGS